jgi:hypothetical protein
LAFVIDGREIVIAFWTREESPDRPYFGFTDDDAGRAARAYARTELGAGRPATLREGLWIGITSPLILRELSEQGIVLPGFESGRVQIPAPLEGGLKIEPGDPVELTLVADPDDAALARSFTARPVLAEEPAKGDVVAAADGIQLSLQFFTRDALIDVAAERYRRGRLPLPVLARLCDCDCARLIGRVRVCCVAVCVECGDGVECLAAGGDTEATAGVSDVRADCVRREHE